MNSFSSGSILSRFASLVVSRDAIALRLLWLTPCITTKSQGKFFSEICNLNLMSLSYDNSMSGRKLDDGALIPCRFHSQKARVHVGGATAFP